MRELGPREQIAFRIKGIASNVRRNYSSQLYASLSAGSMHRARGLDQNSIEKNELAPCVSSIKVESIHLVQFMTDFE